MHLLTVADRDVKTFFGKVDGLAFSPVQDVKAGIDILLLEAPDQLRLLVEYFNSYYVNGKLKAVRNKVTNNISFRRTPFFHLHYGMFMRLQSMIKTEHTTNVNQKTIHYITLLVPKILHCGQ